MDERFNRRRRPIKSRYIGSRANRFPARSGSCNQDSDCASGLECVTAGYPGGYCSELDCNSGACPTQSDCFITEENEPTMCLAFCDSDSDCRLGYSCFDPGVCYPDGSGGSGEERCTHGACPSGEICASSGTACPWHRTFQRVQFQIVVVPRQISPIVL